jgi:hypothetical protein
MIMAVIKFNSKKQQGSLPMRRYAFKVSCPFLFSSMRNTRTLTRCDERTTSDARLTIGTEPQNRPGFSMDGSTAEPR